MHVLTPFDFIDRFAEGATLAIVGNAGSARQYSHGAMIDDHDYVVRFNECALAGYEAAVGKRTSILVCNPYAETRSRPLLDGLEPDVVLTIASQTRRGSREVFERWVGDLPVLFTYCPDLVGVEDSTHRHGLTTGTYAVQLLWRLLRPSRIFVTGFTMFAAGEPSHYWRSGRSAGERAHDVEAEAALFVRLLDSIKCRLAVTPDVVRIAERTAVPLRQDVEVVAAAPGAVR